VARVMLPKESHSGDGTPGFRPATSPGTGD
jgi:hypothetical protein